MKTKEKKPIQVALYGMDERTYKTMVMFLQGPCKGIAVVVDEQNAEIDLIDADYIKARDVLDERQSKTPERPIILLSLQVLSLQGTIYVKKPVQSPDLIAALKQGNEILHGGKAIKGVGSEKDDAEPKLEPEFELEDKTESTVEESQGHKKELDKERQKPRKHRTARDLTEVGFSSYMGHVDGVDFSDPEQVLLATYNPKSYFLGYVKTAIKVAKEKSRILQLNSGWKSLVIFPHSNEIWLDADDKQLRIYAGLEIKKSAKNSMSLSPIDQDAFNFGEKMENFDDIDAFIWKLAIWTSKGQYPVSIDINRPVYLKQWPNFTRLVVTPHAMRIAALLIDGPRTAMNLADALNIKPQYVFVFISAAKTLGLLGQAKRNADILTEPPEVKPSKSKGILSRILGRLRGE